MDPREWQDSTPLSDPIFTPRDVAFDDEVEERPRDDVESRVEVCPLASLRARQRRIAEDFDRRIHVQDRRSGG